MGNACIVSGFCWITGGVSGIYAVRKAGLAVSQGIWSCVNVMVCMCWGILVFEEDVTSNLEKARSQANARGPESPGVKPAKLVGLLFFALPVPTNLFGCACLLPVLGIPSTKLASSIDPCVRSRYPFLYTSAPWTGRQYRRDWEFRTKKNDAMTREGNAPVIKALLRRTRRSLPGLHAYACCNRNRRCSSKMNSSGAGGAAVSLLLVALALSFPKTLAFSPFTPNTLTYQHNTHNKNDRRQQMVGGDQPGPGQRKKKKKKNKYANFSKADKLEKDPLEIMIEESEAKVKEIEIKKARKRNKKLPLSEEEAKARREEKRERNKLEFPDVREIDPYDPTTYGYIELGAITGSHGVHGLVKVNAVTQFPERLCEKGVRHIKAPSRRSPREIQLLEGRHRLGDEYLVKLKGVGDRDSANKLRGSVLYARQTDRPKDIADDEYLVADLVGLEVFLADGYSNDDSDDLAGKFVGRIGGIVLAEEMCAVPGLGHDMIEVILPRGRAGTPSWRDELVLLPFVPEIIPSVDLSEGRCYVSPPAGLLDLTYVKEEKVRIKGFLPPAKEGASE